MSSKRSDSETIERLAAQWVFRREAGLSESEEEEYTRWVKADTRHEEAMARHERAWESLDRPRLNGQAGQILEGLRRRRVRRQRVRLGSAAAIVAIAFTSFFWVRTSHDNLRTEGILVLAPEKRLLEDGSVVELKPESRIRVEYTATRRQVVLERGEAHFQVAHKAGRPFCVVAGNVEFRAVGTAFSVQMDTGALALIVTQGTVAVEETGVAEQLEASESRLAQPATTPIALVSAGRKAVVPREVKRHEVSLAEAVVPAEEVAEMLSWRIPRLEFTETPLEKAIELLNQYNSVKLTIEDRDLAELRVSGLFRADRVETFVHLLETNFGVRATRSDLGFVLRKLR